MTLQTQVFSNNSAFLTINATTIRVPLKSYPTQIKPRSEHGQKTMDSKDLNNNFYQLVYSISSQCSIYILTENVSKPQVSEAPRGYTNGTLGRNGLNIIKGLNN